MSAPVTFTSGAVKEIKKLISQPGFDNSQFLRVGVKGGGCSGMTYILGFDAKQENDELFEIDGVSFIMNKSHGLYLMGMQIDWQDGLNARGFSFSNPNASMDAEPRSPFSMGVSYAFVSFFLFANGASLFNFLYILGS
jgi:iron-sulfur cluster assembly protein